MLDQPLFAAVKERLADVPGIDRMSVSNIAGRLEFGMDGKLAIIDENAADNQIDAAIRATFGGHITPPPVAMPLVAAATTTQPQGKSMSITGAAPATLSIKAMIEKSRSTVQAAHQKLTDNAAKVQQAADALSSLGDDLGKEGDDLLAMVGQYKNDLSGS